MIFGAILLLILVPLVKSEEISLNENELKISSDLIDFLQIRQSIIVKKNILPANITKIFRFRNVPVMFLSEDQLFKYILSNPLVFWKTMIIYKSSNNFSQFSMFLHELEPVSIFHFHFFQRCFLSLPIFHCRFYICS